MFQPSELTDSLLFLGSMLLLIAIFIPTFLWGMRRTISNIQKLPEFTDLDVIVVRHQLLALLVGLPLLLLFFAFARLLLDRPTPSIVFIALIMGFAPLTYIAASSIRNRVSILRGGGRLPIKGTKAVRSGVINLVLVVLMFTGFAIFLALQFASLTCDMSPMSSRSSPTQRAQMKWEVKGGEGL
jgi:hypothetical protein